MPVTKTAKRALRSSKKKQLVNKKIAISVEKAIKKVRKDKNKKSFSEASSTIDKAAKKKVIHKNKASRIKSRLAKFIKK